MGRIAAILASFVFFGVVASGPIHAAPSPGPRNLEQAQQLNQSAYRLYNQGDYAGAANLFGQILQLKRSLLGNDDISTLTTINDYAAALNQSGRVAESEPYYLEALERRKKTLGPSHSHTLISMNNYAFLQERLGRFQEAETLYAETLRLRRSTLGENDLYTINSLNNYGNILVKLERAEEAVPVFEETVARFRRIVGEKSPETLDAMNNLAVTLDTLGRAKDAEPIAEKALKYYAEVLGPRHPLTANSYQNYGAIIDSLAGAARAAPFYQKAYETRLELLGADHPDTLVSLNNYALALKRLGRFDAAETYYKIILEKRLRLLGESHPDTLLSTSNLASLYHDKGQYLLAYGLVKSLMRGLRDRENTFAGTLRGDVQREREMDAKIKQRAFFADVAWFAGKSKPASTPIYRRDAFSVLQEMAFSKASRALQANAARVAAERTAGLGSLVRKKQDLTEEGRNLYTDLTGLLTSSDSATSSKRSQTFARIAQINQQIASIDAAINEQAPEYFSLVSDQPLDADKASQLMASDEAALLLVPSERGTHALLVTSSGITWNRSDWSEKQIDSAVKRLSWDVGVDVDISAIEQEKWQDEGAGAYPFDFVTAHALYRQLVEPFAEALAQKTHLYVVSTGSLANLPLGILVESVPEGSSGDPAVLRSAKWLSDRFAIARIPSLGSLQILRNNARQSSGSFDKPFIGVGDPLLSGASELRGGGTRRGGRRQGSAGFSAIFQSRGNGNNADESLNIEAIKNLAKLPGTARELNAMWIAFGNPAEGLYLQEAANEQNVKTMALNASVIAFATHGLLAGEIDGLSEPGLVLTPPSVATRLNDGYLGMSEIAELKIHSDWVILSACNTAASDGSEGASGLSGLAKAFLFSGANGLLVSHWPVRDDVAAKLTVAAIENQRNNPNLSPAEALKAAMKSIREDPQADSENDTWAHPNAWAPFSFVGDR